MDQSPKLRRGLEVVAGSLADVVEAEPDVVEDSSLAADDEALDVESSAMELDVESSAMALDVNKALASVEESVELVPDSIELVPDSADIVSDTVEAALDAVDFVPETDKVVQCPRCGTFHVGGVFGEACYQARRNARRCARCGLLHADYDRLASALHGTNGFECEIYVPEVDKLQMDGGTILLPDHVLKKLDKFYSRKKFEEAKTKKDTNKEQ